MSRYRPWWLIAGPILFLAVASGAGWFPELSAQARYVLAALLWMACWWMSEAVPLAATALLPLVLFPLTGVMAPGVAARAYGHEIIFLFLGGFLVAGAVESSGLHRRLALHLVAATGTSPGRMVGGFMIASAGLSMWISNSATAIMMLPVALSVADRMRRDQGPGSTVENFEKALLLGIAYGASIGGVATLIGTPPNLVLAASVEQLSGESLDFARWLMVGLPLVALLLPLAWLYLTRWLFVFPTQPSEAAGSLVRAELDRLGRASREEKVVLAIFVAMACCWLCRSSKEIGPLTLPGLDLLMPGLKDSTIAIAAAVLCFVVPSGKGQWRPVLTWEVSSRVPWGVIILFGGGLCLAQGVNESGLALAFSQLLAQGATSPWVTIALVVAGTVVLTEFTSNTATAALLMPLLATAAVGAGHHPLGYMIPGAVACSFAFCLPVATPPNAIVYGCGRLSMGDMLRAGLLMNLLAYLVWMLLFAFVALPLLGIDLYQPPNWVPTTGAP